MRTPEETRKKSGMPDLTTLEGEHEQIANLEIAVAHRTVIGQAIGILHERFGMDSEHASAVLARLSPGREHQAAHVSDDPGRARPHRPVAAAHSRVGARSSGTPRAVGCFAGAL